MGIPAYGRCSELGELLQSIYEMTVLPREITVCEDCSPVRDDVRDLLHSWIDRFEVEGCRINYYENRHNLGYDANLRQVIGKSTCPWVMIMGNDDLVLKGCIKEASDYLQTHPGITMVSRAFVRFSSDIDRPIGVSRLSKQDSVFNSQNSSAQMIFRSCGFIAGLLVDRCWAETHATDKYDGTLYYQLYLASIAFCQAGIGYISTPIAGGRSGNAPSFGVSVAERAVHIPGSYSPKGRAKMWAGVLEIGRDVGEQFGMDIERDLKRELAGRQSFHVFEMYAGADRSILRSMRDELVALQLFDHIVPRFLYHLNFLLGRRAKHFYDLVRAGVQR